MEEKRKAGNPNWQKGVSGNPRGRPKGTFGRKPWTQALLMEGLRATPKGNQKFLRLAEKCYEMALNGDINAIREIGDRVEGKATQESNINVNTAKAQDMTDDELAAIAAAGGEDNNGEAGDTEVSDEVVSTLRVPTGETPQTLN